MADQELVQLREELATFLKPQFWGSQIKGAPECVILMAQCKVLVSKSSAMTLDLSGSGLRYQTLSGNIDYCTQLGEDVFESTGERMKRVGKLTHDMSKPGGIIESMLKHIDPRQSAFQDRQLRSCVAKGIKRINESMRLISDIGQDFEAWKAVTLKLNHALRDKASFNEQRRVETQKALNAQSLEKTKLEVDLEQARTDLAQLQRESAEGFMADDTVPGGTVPGSIPASRQGTFAGAAAAAAAVRLAPEIHALLIVSTGVSFAILHYRRSSLRSIIRDLEKENMSLSDMIERLSGKSQSIMSLETDEIRSIVTKALKDLTLLQGQIKDFMDFLSTIQNMMLSVNDNREDVFMEDLTPEERKELVCDAEFKKKLGSDALLMKGAFLTAAKATALYNEVSEQFVIPGVRWVSGLCLVDSTDDVLAEKAKEIEQWRGRICIGATNWIDRRVDEIGIRLKDDNSKAVDSFEKAVLGQTQRVAAQVEDEISQD